jgi:catechol 2,3-dioxygenase-like lactoylglutathione lyase family enzyme
MTETSRKPKLVGINHVAIEVGDIDAALAFYGAIFDFTLRGRAPGHAFIDLGDQFLAMSEVAAGVAGPIPERHFGLVVDDRDAVRSRIEAAGATILPGGFLDFLDPWGNRVEIVDYRGVQFTKMAAVLAKLGVDPRKTDAAKRELREKGMADE